MHDARRRHVPQPLDGRGAARDAVPHAHRGELEYHLDDAGVPNEIAVEPAHDRLLRDALPPSPARPRIGEGSKDILAWLGVDEARMAELKDEGVVNWPDEGYAAAW